MVRHIIPDPIEPMDRALTTSHLDRVEFQTTNVIFGELTVKGVEQFGSNKI